MINFKISRRFVTFTCLTLVTILYPLGARAEKINIKNWAIEITAKWASESVPVYLRAKDSKESGTIIEIPKSPYISGLSSIVLVKRGEGQALGFVAGKLSSPGNRLSVVEIKVRNTEKASKSFRIGDINLASSDGKILPYAAIAKGDSYLVAKTSVGAWGSSLETTISVDSDEKLKLTYCFIVPLTSFPVRLGFQKTKTKVVIEYDKIAEYKAIESPKRWMMVVGEMTVGFNLEVKDTYGILANKDTDVKFKSEVKYSKGDVMAARNMGGVGASSINTRDISEKLNGKVSTRTLSSAYLFSGGTSLAGTITMLKHITPFKMVIPLGEPEFRTIFKSSFHAKKGDVLAAVGQVGDSDAKHSLYFLSAHTLAEATVQ